MTQKQGALYILRLDGVATFVQIGRIVEGRGPVVDPRAARAPQGSIVYVRGE